MYVTLYHSTVNHGEAERPNQAPQSSIRVLQTGITRTLFVTYKRQISQPPATQRLHVVSKEHTAQIVQTCHVSFVSRR